MRINKKRRHFTINVPLRPACSVICHHTYIYPAWTRSVSVLVRFSNLPNNMTLGELFSDMLANSPDLFIITVKCVFIMHSYNHNAILMTQLRKWQTRSINICMYVYTHTWITLGITTRNFIYPDLKAQLHSTKNN